MRAALAGGATAIQLRAKKDEPGRLQVELARELAALCREHGALFIVNDRLDVALAVGADGVHLGQDDLPVAEARRLAGPGFIIGCSVENVEQAQAAATAGADYLGVGPVYPTATKADAGPATGLYHLGTVKAATHLPVVGIGGINQENAADVMAAGADGVAVISAVSLAQDVEGAAARLAAAVREGLARRPRGDAATPVAGEFRLIDDLSRILPPPRTATVGIGDDAAVLPGPDGRPAYVMACDLLVEDVHFHYGTGTAAQLGWKSLAVNVSDIGAMGAEPLWAVVGLAVPPHWSQEALTDLYEGLAEAARRWKVDIVGGDTTRSPRGLTLNVTLMGRLLGEPVLRRGARPGDLVAVTGTLGAAAAGLAWSKALAREGKDPAGEQPEWARQALAAWLAPVPPAEAGAALGAAGLPTAMIDISDGLAADLHHILQAAGVGAVIHEEKIPVAPAAEAVARRLGVDPLPWALGGGEDYQLLFTVPPHRQQELAPVLSPLGVQWTVIGEITTEAGAQLVRPDGTTLPLHRQGWDHFAG